MSTVATVSTHVLDASLGRPAEGVAVQLFGPDGAVLAEAVTDGDGRVSRLTLDPLPAGDYRLVFATGEYFSRSGTSTFYPQVSVTFSIAGEGGHHHVPLLLSPYAYSTYRGS